MGMVLVGLVAGPPVARWFEARQSKEPVAPSPSVPVPGARAPLEVTAAPGVEPAPIAAALGVEAALGREALALYREGRVSEACEKYREILGRTSSEDVRRNLGSCLARLGREAYQADQAKIAVEHYQRALEAYPGLREVWTWLAVAHVKAGDLAAAQAVLEQALRNFPDDAEALYLLAEVQERQGRTREAVETLRRLLGAHPGHARGRALLASLDREQKVEGSYWAHESRHFLVRYEGAQGIDLGRSVVDTLEEAYDSIGRDLGTYPKERIQVGIYATPVFGDVIGAPPHFIAGAYDGKKIRLNLAASAAHSNNLSRLVRHEYTHALIHLATNGRAPIWLHEGLAQLMEPRSAPRLLQVRVPREYLTLEGIERLSRTQSPEALVAGYSLTHIAVEHLVDRGGLSGMRDFLARLGQGEPLPQALRNAFGFGPEDIEARLLAAGGKG